MVDPDNRRPVDFAAREPLLDRTAPPDITNWRDGSVKLAVIQRLLRLRTDDPDLFALGSYEPVQAGEHTVAFLRRHENRTILVAVQLHPWHAPTLALPQDLLAKRWRELLSGAPDVPESAALAPLSVAVWELSP